MDLSSSSIDSGGGAEGQGFVDLLFADAGDDVGAYLERGEEGAAADGTEGAGEDEGLAWLDVRAAADELVAGE